ncbi:hypothetical protein NFI96_010503 [Prochilodus magdalenae]|nr:hypothetical protein NFI96_010503 [Prochilodus magdalenae]
MFPTGCCPQDTVNRTLTTGRCAQDVTHRMLTTGRCAQDVTHRMLTTGCCAQDVTHRMLTTGRCSQDVTHRMLTTGRCSQDVTHRTLTTGRCAQDVTHRMLTTGRCVQDVTHRMLTTGRCSQDVTHRTLTTGRCAQDVTHRTLTTGRCAQDADHRTLCTGCYPQDADHRTLFTGCYPQDADHRTLCTGCSSQDADYRMLLTGRYPQDFGDGPFLFQHDRTPVHRASSIKTWRSESGVEELDWPAQSPHLHPIEHLWDGLERRLRARPSRPTSVSDLTNVLLCRIFQVWYAGSECEPGLEVCGLAGERICPHQENIFLSPLDTQQSCCAVGCGAKVQINPYSAMERTRTISSGTVCRASWNGFPWRAAASQPYITKRSAERGTQWCKAPPLDSRAVEACSLEGSITLLRLAIRWTSLGLVVPFGDGPFLFQHDRTPVHRASSIKTWMSESGVEELDRPAQSPDLNPIEHLWDGLERRLRARPSRPTSVSDLTDVLLEEWSGIPISTFLTLVERIPRRAGAANGPSSTDHSVNQWRSDVKVIPIMRGTEPNARLIDLRMMYTNEPPSGLQACPSPEKRRNADIRWAVRKPVRREICAFKIHGQEAPFEAEVLNRTSGEGVLRARGPVDCEQQKEYTFIIQAYDCGAGPSGASWKKSHKAVVHVQVDDVNEFSPVFREPVYRATVTEGKIYDSILQVEAWDQDCSPQYSQICNYEIVTQDTPFAIDRNDTPTLLLHLVDGQSETIAHLLLHSAVLVILWSFISGHRTLPTSVDGR